MKASILREPDLEFAYGGRHTDPRHGIDFFGPADLLDAHVSSIRVGIVGTQESIDGVNAWLERCSLGLPAKPSHLGHLYVPFPGFNAETTFHCSIETSRRLLSAAMKFCPETATKLPAGGHETCPVAVMGSARHDVVCLTGSDG